MRYQLWRRDDYGHCSIIETGEDPAKLLDTARNAVQKVNVDNPLTVEFKKKRWKEAVIELWDPSEEEFVDPESAVYGGLNARGQPCVLLTDTNEKLPLKDVEAEVRAYCGHIDGEPWYAEDNRGKCVNDINHEELRSRATYFLKPIG